MVDSSSPNVSVVVPVKNERENLAPLIAEIAAALRGNVAYESVFVDDGSDDDSAEEFQRLKDEHPELRVIYHTRCFGQSAAIASGVKAARADIIVTLDGDGQNDPADIPTLLARYRESVEPRQLMVAGHRAKRRDTWIKRASSRIANAVRSSLLGDATPDTGCGLKVFPRAAYLELPHFNHMHRFLPALMIRGGGRVISVPVNHRPRERGISKYGTWNRLWVGLADLLGVIWLQRRPVTPEVVAETKPGKDDVT